MNTILTDDEIVAIKRSTKILDTNPWAESRAFARAIEAAVLAKLREQEPVKLDHIACIQDGELRYMTARKAPAHDCELYAMPDGRNAPPLYAAPLPAVVQEPLPGVILHRDGKVGFVDQGTEDWHCQHRQALRLVVAHEAPAQGEPLTLDEERELFRLREAVKGPDGFATWQEAATAERVRRVKAERELAELKAQPPQGEVRNAEDELNCAEEVLDGYAAHLDMDETSFDCIGDYITAVCEALKAAPEAPAQGMVQADPCPGCKVGGVCRTPKCGRLKLPTDHPFRTGKTSAQAIPAPWREAVKVAREALESAQAGVIETLGCGDWSPTDPLRVANRKIGAALAQLDALEGCDKTT